MSGKNSRAVWYCKHAGCEDYSTLSTVTAKNHLSSFHDEHCGDIPISKTAQKIQSDRSRLQRLLKRLDAQEKMR